MLVSAACIATLSACVSQPTALNLNASPEPISAQASNETLGVAQQNSQSLIATATDAETGETSLVAIPQSARTANQPATAPANQTLAAASAPLPSQPLTQPLSQTLAIAETDNAEPGTTTTAQGVIANAVTPSAPQPASQTSIPASSAVLQGSEQTANETVNAAVPLDADATPAIASTQANTAPQQAATQTTQQPAQSQNLFARLFQSSAENPRQKPKKSTIRRNGRDDDTIRIASAHDRAKPRVNAARRAQTEAAVAASQSRSTANRNASALPGVKSNAEIFGIKPSNETGSDNAGSAVTPETRLAAAGSLGLLSPNGLRVQHDKVQVACLKPGVIRLLKVVERHYGKKPIITSGYRSPNRNRRAGGAKNSQHIYCKAVDIQVEGVSKWNLAKFLRTVPGRGGVGTYCRTNSVHLDIGSKRDWHHPCRRSSKRKKKKA